MPRRPPPLDPNLFKGSGPLAPGSAPLPPSPSTIHPPYIIDAHSFTSSLSSSSTSDQNQDRTDPQNPESILQGLRESFPKPMVKSVVEVKLDVGSEPAQAAFGFPRRSQTGIPSDEIKSLAKQSKPRNLFGPSSSSNPFTFVNTHSTNTHSPSISVNRGVKPHTIHPTILNLTLKTPPSITNISKGAVDIVVPVTAELGETEWDLIDEAVGELVRSSGEGGRVVISGVLPPPFTKPSTRLSSTEHYSLYTTRLAQLSLYGNVYLKVLPPLISGQEGEIWWKEKSEVDRVLKMYLSPAIETFGTHRLMFGSSPALPLLEFPSGNKMDQVIPSTAWYAALRQCLAALGEVQEAMAGIMGGNAARVYELDG